MAHSLDEEALDRASEAKGAHIESGDARVHLRCQSGEGLGCGGETEPGASSGPTYRNEGCILGQSLGAKHRR